MKKIISILLVITMALSFCVLNVSAEENIKVIIDIKNVKFDVPPTIVNGRTLVPLRAIFEALGATVDWNDETQTVTSEKGETKISLTINSNIMTVNGEEKTLDVPATLIDSRTLVPVRAISEAFGLQVGWDGENNIVSILSNTEVFTMLYAKGGRSKVFAKSSAATQAKHGWNEYPVTAVYSADGKETVVASDEVQSYIDSGYYAYPVKTVFAADGSEVVIRAEEFNAYLANGFFVEKPVVKVESEKDDDKIDYSEYAGINEEEMIKIGAVYVIKEYFEDPKAVKLRSVYAGYYNDMFIIILELNGLIQGQPSELSLTCKLEEKGIASIVGQVYTNGYSLPAPRIQWANDLIAQKTNLFKGYNSNALKNSIIELASKK